MLSSSTYRRLTPTLKNHAVTDRQEMKDIGYAQGILPQQKDPGSHSWFDSFEPAWYDQGSRPVDNRIISIATWQYKSKPLQARRNARVVRGWESSALSPAHSTLQRCLRQQRTHHGAISGYELNNSFLNSMPKFTVTSHEAFSAYIDESDARTVSHLDN
jgi:hypothetical protein